MRQVSDNTNNLHKMDRECGLHVTSLEIEQELGLHITLLEDAPDPRRIESVYIFPGETEILRFYNHDSIGWFQCLAYTGALPINNISSDILSSNGITYVPSKLRLFRTFDSTIHIHK